MAVSLASNINTVDLLSRRYLSHVNMLYYVCVASENTFKMNHYNIIIHISKLNIYKARSNRKMLNNQIVQKAV